MTKKNAKKLAARARQEEHGGHYQRHLRQIGGASGTSAEPPPSGEALRTTLPPTRHVFLSQPAAYELDVFTVNQSISYFIAKFKKSGWSAAEHRLDPRGGAGAGRPGISAFRRALRAA